VLKHTADGENVYWSSAAVGKGKEEGKKGGKNVRVLVLERGAFGVFEGEEALWTSDGVMHGKDVF